MTEYINQEQLLGQLKSQQEEPLKIMKEIAEFPAADVAPVKHGKWIRMDNDGEAISKCSVCKFPVSTFWNESNYCPDCGSKMDLEEIDNVEKQVEIHRCFHRIHGVSQARIKTNNICELYALT